MNDDMIRYILSYLQKCSVCDKYHIYNHNNKCSICKDSFCESCTIKLKNFYGFFENKICNDCDSYYGRI